MTPNRLLNHLQERLGVKTDKEVAARLGYNKHHLSRIRNRRYPLTKCMVRHIARTMGLSTGEVWQLAGGVQGEEV